MGKHPAQSPTAIELKTKGTFARLIRSKPIGPGVTVQQEVAGDPPVPGTVRSDVRITPGSELIESSAIGEAHGERSIWLNPQLEGEFSHAEARRQRALVGEVEVIRFALQESQSA